MPKLYELAEQYNNLLDLIDNPEVQQELLDESLDSINDELDIKLENIAKVIKSIEIDVKGLKEEEKRLADRRKNKENKINNLKEYAQGSMMAVGIKKVEGKLFTLSIQKNPPSVKILDENSIPGLYKKEIITTKIDKSAIRDILKKGEEVAGTRLEQDKSLRIK